MKRLKIVHFTTGLGVGGAEKALYKLVSRLDKARFESVVVSMIAGGAVADDIKALGVPVYTLGARRGQPTPAVAWRLLRLLRREKPAVLQNWQYHANLLGLIAGKLAGVPAIGWNVRSANQDLLSYSRSTVLTVKATARLSRWPDVVVINSKAGQDFHKRLGYKPRRWALIPNGFDLRRFTPDAAARGAVRQELDLAPDALLIGLVARYHPLKDHETFLRAAGLLHQQHPAVHFLLVGTDVAPSNAALMAMVDKNGLRDVTHLLGERSDVPRLLAALDIFTLSSLSEAFSNAIGEAMACGLPCVVTDVGDSAVIVGETGLVVPRRDPAAMAAAWDRLIMAGADERARLGALARARAQQEYSLEQVVQTYEALYSQLGHLN